VEGNLIPRFSQADKKYEGRILMLTNKLLSLAAEEEARDGTQDDDAWEKDIMADREYSQLKDLFKKYEQIEQNAASATLKMAASTTVDPEPQISQSGHLEENIASRKSPRGEEDLSDVATPTPR
jgi:hypothetical protein